MRKTGSTIYRTVLAVIMLLLLFASYGNAWDREVILSVNAEKRKVAIGEELSIVYSISVEDQKKFRLHMEPKFPDFTVIDELVRSKNSFIGGVAYTTFTYSYLIKPKKAGLLKTGRASFIYSKVTYTTAPVEITVLSEKPLPVVKQKVADRFSSLPPGTGSDIIRAPKQPPVKPEKIAKKPGLKPGSLKVASEALMKDDHRFKKPATESKTEKTAKKEPKMTERKPSSLKVASEALIRQKNRYKVDDKDQLITYNEKKVAEQSKYAETTSKDKKDVSSRKSKDDVKKTADKPKVAKRSVVEKSKQAMARRETKKKSPKYPKKRGKIFVHATVDRYDPFVSEGLIYTFKLFHKPDYYGSPAFTPPAFKGFFVEELPMTRSTDNSKELGEEYIVEEVNYALYPLVNGNVTIPEATLEFRDYNGRHKTAKTNTVEIDVLRLPMYDRSLNAPFSGSVGRFKTSQKIDVNEAVKSEPFTLTVTVRGQGNVLSISEPAIPSSRDFTYTLIDTSENVITGFDGLSGGKTFTYSVTAKRSGTFLIGGTSYVYFDPDEMRYVKSTTEKVQLTVSAGTESEDAQIERHAQLMSLLVPIRVGIEIEKWEPFYKSGLFLYMMLALLFSSMLVLSFSFKRIYESKNKDAIKRKKALKNALSGIDYTRGYLKNQRIDDFYTELHALLNRFYIDHFGVDLITHPIDSIPERISGNGNGNGKELVTSLTDKVKLLNYYRYASRTDVTEIELNEFLTELKDNIMDFKRGNA